MLVKTARCDVRLLPSLADKGSRVGVGGTSYPAILFLFFTTMGWIVFRPFSFFLSSFLSVLHLPCAINSVPLYIFRESFHCLVSNYLARLWKLTPRHSQASKWCVPPSPLGHFTDTGIVYNFICLFRSFVGGMVVKFQSVQLVVS